MKEGKMMSRKLLLGITLLLIISLLTGCSGVKKADLDVAQSQVTTLQNQLSAANAAKIQADENKSLIRRYYDAVNLWDPNALDQYFSPNYKRYTSATADPLTIAGQKQRLAGLRAAFPDLKLTVDDVIAEGDRVAISLTARGTHLGTFQGIAPTGKTVMVSAFEVIRVEDGKLIEHWGGPDTLNLLQQIGAVISAGK
jgi:steroid delta-isomerase-like uncharacterized protein